MNRLFSLSSNGTWNKENAVVPCGTTGESSTLSHAEYERVIALCVEAASRRVPVIAGAGSNSTAEAVEMIKHAKQPAPTRLLW